MAVVRHVLERVRGKVCPPLAVGQWSPDFTLEDQDGRAVHLFDYRDRHPVVLVFYPGDNTPGCTRQLCALRDSYASLEASGAKVFGINPAGRASKKGFADAHHLPFPLLSDPGNRVALEFQAALPRLPHTFRTVYVIGKDGKIQLARSGAPSVDEIRAALR